MDNHLDMEALNPKFPINLPSKQRAFLLEILKNTHNKLFQIIIFHFGTDCNKITVK